MSSVNYNRTEKLRFWCQKVLPIVYDDSLSYYELLNKVVVYLNSTIEDVQSVIDEITSLEQSVGNKIDKSQKGVANGVATLGSNGKVPLSQLPDVSTGVQSISVNGVPVPADSNKNVNIVVMTNSVSNLVNYYLKTETYNKSEVNTLIDNVKNSRFEVVAQLPTSDIQTNVIYLVPKVDGEVQNGYDEYINLDGTTSGWELIGSTDIDLSGYVTDSELATALTSYVTTQALNATLADYVSNSALATALSGYVQMSMFNALSGVVSQQGEALADRVDIFAVTQSRETGDTATTLHNVNTFVWVDKITNIFGSHLFKVIQTVNVGDNWASIKSSKLSDVTVSGELRDIEGKIPTSASASNKLATAGDVTTTIDLLKDTTGWISKNAINDENYGKAVSLTVQKDGHSFTLATNNQDQYASLSFFASKPVGGIGTLFSAGKWKIILNVSVVGDNTASISVRRANNSIIASKNLQVGEIVFDIETTDDFYISIFPRFEVTTVTTLSFSNIMMCEPDKYALSPTYEPYHDSVEEMLFYKAGDEVQLNGLGFAGFVTNSSTELHVAFTLSKIIKATNVSLAGQLTVRGLNGYVLQSKQISELTVSVEKIAENVAMIILKNSDNSAFNVTNNTPLFFTFELATAKLTFTA